MARLLALLLVLWWTPVGSAERNRPQCPSLAGLKLVLEARAGWTAQVDWARVRCIADPDTHREVLAYVIELGVPTKELGDQTKRHAV